MSIVIYRFHDLENEQTSIWTEDKADVLDKLKEYTIISDNNVVGSFILIEKLDLDNITTEYSVEDYIEDSEVYQWELTEDGFVKLVSISYDKYLELTKADSK